MPTRLRTLWEKIRSSYWFVPGMMACCAVALSYSCLWLDGWLRDDVLRGLDWTYTGGPEGARAVLSTIAGSMITVAGVTFSITIVALSLASQQFGPRLLRNFMRDAGNKVVLGTFLSTFLYSLLVLRTVRGTEDVHYVPHLSVTVAVGLAVTSVGVLIYFIHHASESIQVSHLLAAVAADLDTVIDRLFPQTLGQSPTEPGYHREPVADVSVQTVSSVLAEHEGYLQLVDEDLLLAAAQDSDVVLRLRVRPGEFVVRGAVLLTVSAAGHLKPALAPRLLSAFVLGRERTTTQDAAFALRQFVEVALRALSPAINDPFTAMACVDRLSAALCRLAGRTLPSPARIGPNGVLRVVTLSYSYAEFVEIAYEQIRVAAQDHEAVIRHMEQCVEMVLSRTQDAEFRQALIRKSRLLKLPG